MESCIKDMLFIKKKPAGTWIATFTRKINQTRLIVLAFSEFLAWKEEVKKSIYTMIYSSGKYIYIQHFTLIAISQVH